MTSKWIMQLQLMRWHVYLCQSITVVGMAFVRTQLILVPCTWKLWSKYLFCFYNIICFWFPTVFTLELFFELFFCNKIYILWKWAFSHFPSTFSKKFSHCIHLQILKRTGLSNSSINVDWCSPPPKSNTIGVHKYFE